MHCVFTKASPLEVEYIFTTVRLFSLVFLIRPTSGISSRSGSGKPFSSAHSHSQPWHPAQRVESYRTLKNSVSSVFFFSAAAFSFLPAPSDTPVIPSAFRKLRRFIL